jgi:hypothetical protein
VLKQVKSMTLGRPDLKRFQLRVFKFHDLAALGADHMVMVLPQMEVFIQNFTVLELPLAGEPILTHEFQGVTDKFGIQPVTQIVKPLNHLCRGHMPVGPHEGFHDGKPIFEIRYVILSEQLAELFLFLLVQCLRHRPTLVGR